jgi:hypothetical protein
MSVRAFNVWLINGTEVTISKTFDHLCGGDWTPALSPPSSIPANSQVLFRSESAGIATGTEGYVKYGIPSFDSNNNPTQDELYIYWDNPFAFGVTHGLAQVSTQGIQPDCDYTKTAGNVFPPPPSRFQVFKQSAAGPGGSLEPFWELAAGPIFAVPILFGNLGIVDEGTMILELAPVPNPASVRSFAMNRGFDVSKGLRAFTGYVSGVSMKTYMGLP